jgi:hypothetical protein
VSTPFSPRPTDVQHGVCEHDPAATRRPSLAPPGPPVGPFIRAQDDQFTDGVVEQIGEHEEAPEKQARGEHPGNDIAESRSEVPGHGKGGEAAGQKNASHLVLILGPW